MDQPPAPVLDLGNMRVLVPHQRGAVEQSDRNRGQEQQGHHCPRCRRRPTQDRPQGAAHQRQPQQQSDEQEPLPEPTHVGIFPTLVAEPEIILEPQLLHDRQVLSGEGSNHDQQQADEQEIHAESLEPGLVARERRPDVKARCQPCRRNPQDGELGMPGACERVGQDAGKLEPVGRLALDLVVRGDGAEQDLAQEQGKHYPEIFCRRTHRGRRFQFRERIGGRQGFDFVVASVVDGVVPAEQRDARDQEHDAEHGPAPKRRRRLVAHQRFVRPVVGVGNLLAGQHAFGADGSDDISCAFGGCCPGGPPEEGSECPAMLGGIHRVLLHRVRFAQRGSSRIIAEQALVMRRHVRECRGAVAGQRDRARRFVVSVGAHHLLEATAQCRLLFGRQLRVRSGAAVSSSPEVKYLDGFAMQPVRAPVRRDIAAVAPDRTQLHAAHRLPYLSPGFDVRPGVDHRAIFNEYLFRHGRGGPEYLAAGP